ncbi:MAG TPA: 2-oxoacid:acceptor oxidoreductase family protein [Longimicrobiales bacterium]|nr:2-oxoacid:acceptor oxidoreductase family protein [Longimicrobiales bacterium]
MIEVRIHGRGGQGAVVASHLLAEAAFRKGMHVQAFPAFGSERRGAPVAAFVRMDQDPVLVRTQIYNPDGLIVLDQNLILQKLVDVTAGLKDGGWILINSPKPPETFGKLGPYIVATVDASRIAAQHGLGSATSPIVNTAILGAMAALTGLIGLEELDAAIRANAPVKPDENAAAAREAATAVHILQPAGGRS